MLHTRLHVLLRVTAMRERREELKAREYISKRKCKAGQPVPLAKP
jgi:hypothetical protein